MRREGGETNSDVVIWSFFQEFLEGLGLIPLPFISLGFEAAG